MTGIGYGAFLQNQAIEKVTIPGSVKTVGPFAFGGCTALTQAEFGEGLEVIGVQSFYQCIALEQISIPREPARDRRIRVLL